MSQICASMSERRRRRARIVACAAAVTLVALLAGCAAGNGADAGESGAALPSASSSVPSPVSSAASAAPSRTDTAAPSTPVADGGCPPTSLQITAERMPGASGTTYALLGFTNIGPQACEVSGYPAVELLDAGGAVIAGPARQLPGDAGTIMLASGQAASTLLQDSTGSCVAQIRSSAVRVSAPGSPESSDLPLVLPPCDLALKPLEAGLAPTV